MKVKMKYEPIKVRITQVHSEKNLAGTIMSASPNAYLPEDRINVGDTGRISADDEGIYLPPSVLATIRTLLNEA